MKKLFFVTIFISMLGLSLIFPISSFAQGISASYRSEASGVRTGNITSTNSTTLQNGGGHTAREEAAGKAVWGKLQAKQTTCSDLSDENFGTLGEYFMGQMMGASHEAMNNMMIQMMGEQGEEQIHVVMGKRLSGCDISAAFPSQGVGFMPMMQMMMGIRLPDGQGWSSPFGSHQLNNPMMNFGFTPFGGFGWIFMILWWVLVIAGIVALIRWLTNQSRGAHDHEKSPLEILKERYAKGEIDKKEFEEKKKDLS